MNNTEILEQFLEKELSSDILNFEPINTIKERLESLGFTNLSPEYLDSNGWQYDFWWKIKRKEQKYTISGSLWYGEFKITKN